MEQQSLFKLLLDRNESLSVLKRALNETQDRLIMVCPWLSKYAIDKNILSSIKILLDSNIGVDIGWGLSRDIKGFTLLFDKYFSEEDLSKLAKGSFYTAIQDLYNLSFINYGLFNLKFLDTHEKYLVCDDKFAMLGSHNFLTSDDRSNVKEIGIYTTDSTVIKQLINRYDSSEPIVEIEPPFNDSEYLWFEKLISKDVKRIENIPSSSDLMKLLEVIKYIPTN